MQREMPDTGTSRRDQEQQEERRRQDRRRQDQEPTDDRRQQERRQRMEMSGEGRNMNPDSPPEKGQGGREHQGGGGQMPGNWQGENFQSGTSQAQKAEGHTPKQQSVPAERHEQRGEGTARYSNPSSGKESGPEGRERSFGPSGPHKKSSGG